MVPSRLGVRLLGTSAPEKKELAAPADRPSTLVTFRSDPDSITVVTTKAFIVISTKVSMICPTKRYSTLPWKKTLMFCSITLHKLDHQHENPVINSFGQATNCPAMSNATETSCITSTVILMICGTGMATMSSANGDRRITGT